MEYHLDNFVLVEDSDQVRFFKADIKLHILISDFDDSPRVLVGLAGAAHRELNKTLVNNSLEILRRDRNLLIEVDDNVSLRSLGGVKFTIEETLSI